MDTRTPEELGQAMLVALLESRVTDAMLLLQAGADLTVRDEYGNGPLHCLTLALDGMPEDEGMPQLVQAMAGKLLQAGVPKDDANHFVQTPASILDAHRTLMRRDGLPYRFGNLENMFQPSQVIAFRRRP